MVVSVESSIFLQMIHMFVILDGLCEVPHERLEGHVLEVGVEGDLRLHEGAGPREECLS